MSSDRFNIYVPAAVFTKSDSPDGLQMRIGGLVTTACIDKQGEDVLQRGLDFSPWLESGYYNDNHAPEQDKILGFPESVDFVAKGTQLPNGQIAASDGHWAEGWLLPDWEPAKKIWSLGQSLAKTNGRRQLGFSIEGKIRQRTGALRKTIAQAVVENVAITHRPVNAETGLNVLAKSLLAAEKALSVGAGSAGMPTGPISGEGAGAVLTTESLEQKRKKKLSKAQVFDLFLHRYPGADAITAGRFVDVTLRLQNAGLL